MAGGKIESDRLDLALDRVGQHARTPAADVTPPGAGDIQPSTDKPSTDRPAASSAPAVPQEFETFISAAGRRAAGPSARSPRQSIADFVMPKMSDPTILQSGRSVSILEHLVADVLPNLDAGDELRSLAGAIIKDEIARHRDLLTRLHGGIAA